MVRMAVCGRNGSDMSGLRIHLNRWSRRNGRESRVAFYERPEELMWDMETGGMYDVVIIYRCWQAARMVRERYAHVRMVVVMDSFDEEVYDVQPCFPVYEPIDSYSFEKAMSEALSGAQRRKRFAFRAGRVNHSVSVEDIMYFENDKRLIRIVCTERSYTYYGSMRELECRISGVGGGFIRVHESYMINPDYVREFYTNHLIMENGVSIGISTRRRADTRKRYMEYYESTHI